MGDQGEHMLVVPDPTDPHEEEVGADDAAMGDDDNLIADAEFNVDHLQQAEPLDDIVVQEAEEPPEHIEDQVQEGEVNDPVVEPVQSIEINGELLATTYSLAYQMTSLHKELSSLKGGRALVNVKLLARLSPIKHLFRLMVAAIEGPEAPIPSDFHVRKKQKSRDNPNLPPLLEEEIIYMVWDTNIILKQKLLEKFVPLVLKCGCATQVIPYVLTSELHNMKQHLDVWGEARSRSFVDAMETFHGVYLSEKCFIKQSRDEDLQCRIKYCRCVKCTMDLKIIHCSEGIQNLVSIKKVLIITYDQELKSIAQAHGIRAVSLQDVMTGFEEILEITDFHGLQNKFFGEFDYDAFTFGPKAFAP